MARFIADQTGDGKRALITDTTTDMLVMVDTDDYTVDDVEAYVGGVVDALNAAADRIPVS